jgi:2-amino-4-hydroxy-6-hydroxymethyldihydropteridine diphosphokinase
MNDQQTSVKAYIGMGSNLAQPMEQISAARLDVAAIAGVTEIAFSSLYSSPPMGPQNQPDYINAVMAVSTTLTAPQLLLALQAIEKAHGRVRNQRWGARTLDLDILLYGDQQINLPHLRIPHVGLAERAFVLYPLAEIAPKHLIVPKMGAIESLVEQCPRAGLERLNA